MKSLKAILLIGALSAFSVLAIAQSYPSRTVRIVVPFPAGGNADGVARILAGKLSAKAKGAPFIIDNRPGAAGTIGADAVMSASHDGYTLLFGNSSSFSVIPLMRKVSYTDANGLVPVAKAVDYLAILAARPSLNVKTLAEMSALVKKSPGKHTYGSVGPGSVGQVAFETIKQELDLKMLEIPYKGSVDVVNAMLAGQIDFTIDALTAPHVRQGKLIGLAVFGTRRHPAFPQLPTLSEAGVTSEVAIGGAGLFAPAAIPKEAAVWLEQGLREIMENPALRDTLLAIGAIPEFVPGKAFEAGLRKGMEINRGVLTRAGIETLK